MNNVNTFEGVKTTRRHTILWRCDDGLYKYIPESSDKLTLTVYDPDGKAVSTEKALWEDGEITIVFPDDLPAGFYTYDVALVKNDELIHKTQGTLHVGKV